MITADKIHLFHLCLISFIKNTKQWSYVCYILNDAEFAIIALTIYKCCDNDHNTT